MTAISVSLDDQTVALLRDANPSIPQAVREMVALELFRRGSISSGKAAEIIGTTRDAFIRQAGSLGIPIFDMDDDDLANELRQSSSL